MRKSLLDKQQYEQLMIELMCQIMTKRKKKFPISWEEVSLSKCMAYSGRRDGLFNSHIWEYINLCVHTHIIYIPPSCGLDINLQTRYIKIYQIHWKTFWGFEPFRRKYYLHRKFCCIIPIVWYWLCFFSFILFLSFLTSFPPYIGLHWPPPSPLEQSICTHRPSRVWQSWQSTVSHQPSVRLAKHPK